MTMKTENTIVAVNQWNANFSQTIQKELVHKDFLSEVFLTDSKQITSDCFLISALLPKTHFYYNDVFSHFQQSYDSALILEVCRQVSIYVAHIFYGVSFDSKFIFDSADFEQYIGHNTYTNDINDYKVIIHSKVIDKKVKKNALCGLEIDMNIYINSKLYGFKSMKFSWITPRMWHKLRYASQKHNHIMQKTKQISKEVVCKENILNVVIGDFMKNANIFQAVIIANQNHPAFFDHPLDHISGILIIEAIKQFALAVCSNICNCKSTELQFKSIKVEFKNFCEFYNLNICCLPKENICVKDNEISMDIRIKTADSNESVLSKVTFIKFGEIND